jgi:hypothetical protein
MWLVEFLNTQYLVKDVPDLMKFLDSHKGLTSMKYVNIWNPEEHIKEAQTKKEREERPKEPIPLSRFEGEE